MSPDSSNDQNIEDQFHQLVQVIDATGKAVLPSSNIELLQSIVDAAARIFGAAAASIALVDNTGKNLVFKVASGEGQDEIIGLSIPIDKGIAGYVAMTGQPRAVSDVQKDHRFNQDFAKGTGYIPKSILATPLLLGDRVIGVMEVLDKIAAPSFGIEDMELLGVFSQQAAIAIDQSHKYNAMGEAFIEGLRRLAKENKDPDLQNNLSEIFSEDFEQDVNLVELADLFFQISTLGESERIACLRILSAFAEYSQSKLSFF